jgi:hypothetical protein
VLELLSSHKADILRLLGPANDGWSPEDWRVFFKERAAILEFDGGLPRAEAEARAFAGRHGIGREKPRPWWHLILLAFQLEELMNSKSQRASQEEGEMSETQETRRPNPSDYGMMGVIPRLIRLWRISSRWDSSWIVANGDFRTASGGLCGSRSRPKREENSASCAGRSESNSDRRETGPMNTHTIPTPDEIDAVIFDMIAADAAQCLTTPASAISGRAWPLTGRAIFEGMASATRQLKRAPRHGSPLGGRSPTCMPSRASSRGAGRSRFTCLAKDQYSGGRHTITAWNRSWGWLAVTLTDFV